MTAEFWEESYRQEHRTRHAMEDEIADLREKLDMSLSQSERSNALLETATNGWQAEMERADEYARLRKGVFVPAGVVGCAGEIRHGIDMLRCWQGNERATAAWLAHIDRYSQRLTDLLAEAQ